MMNLWLADPPRREREELEILRNQLALQLEGLNLEYPLSPEHQEKAIRLLLVCMMLEER